MTCQIRHPNAKIPSREKEKKAHRIPKVTFEFPSALVFRFLEKVCFYFCTYAPRSSRRRWGRTFPWQSGQGRPSASDVAPRMDPHGEPQQPAFRSALQNNPKKNHPLAIPLFLALDMLCLWNMAEKLSNSPAEKNELFGNCSNRKILKRERGPILSHNTR